MASKVVSLFELLLSHPSTLWSNKPETLAQWASVLRGTADVKEQPRSLPASVACHSAVLIKIFKTYHFSRHIQHWTVQYTAVNALQKEKEPQEHPSLLVSQPLAPCIQYLPRSPWRRSSSHDRQSKPSYNFIRIAASEVPLFFLSVQKYLFLGVDLTCG